MNVRTFQPGDEEVRVAIYNEAAVHLPSFKPASVGEVQRRCRDRAFDPTTHFFIEDGSQVVGYATYHSNGRVSFPWCRKGHESAAEPLFRHMIQAMAARGLEKAFAAYRADWPEITAFFEQNGFRHARDMVNFMIALTDLPTFSLHPVSVTPLRREDLSDLAELCPQALRVHDLAELEQHFFRNPSFPPASCSAIRRRDNGQLRAVGILVCNSTYADPRKIDSAAPCFRLGTFGTEGLQTVRVHGLFSFLTRNEPDSPRMALDLLSQSATLMEKLDGECLAAQAASDVPHLIRFYESHFRRQGQFPLYERIL